MAGKRSIVDTGPYQQRYWQALLDGDSDAASKIVKELIAKRASVADIYLEVLAPALFQIGELWCDGKVNVAQEHLATQITLGQMDKLRLIQSVPRSLSYRVMVCCVKGKITLSRREWLRTSFKWKAGRWISWDRMFQPRH
jgi:methanogenic corrinoid protein MtbC1